MLTKRRPSQGRLAQPLLSVASRHHSNAASFNLGLLGSSSATCTSVIVSPVRRVVDFYHRVVLLQMNDWCSYAQSVGEIWSKAAQLPTAALYTQVQLRSSRLSMLLSLRRYSTPRRLYLAFYPKSGDVAESSTHTALLLTPLCPNEEMRDTFRYHVSISRGAGWEYRRDQVPARTPQLAAVVYIDDIPPNISEARITKILRSVPIRQCDINWSCYDWVSNALQALEEAGVIGQLPIGGAMRIWERGLQFCRQTYTDLSSDLVPACDVLGSFIESDF